jgi:hypothetical protein
VQTDENGDPHLHDVLKGLQIQQTNHIDTSEVNLSNSNLSTNPVHLSENADRMPRISKSGMTRMPAPEFNITRNLASVSESRTSRMLEYRFNILQPNMDVFEFSPYAHHGIQHQNPSGPNNVAGTRDCYYAPEEFRFFAHEETSNKR